MFLKFNSTEARRAYGGSAFLELQYCSLPAGTPEKKIVSCGSIRFWDVSSLYIFHEDWDRFYAEYQAILGNSTTGLDLYGLNYYSAEKTEDIIKKIEVQKPGGHDVFLKWIRENPYNNGFYILGI